MKREYDLSKMKRRPNPYARRLKEQSYGVCVELETAQKVLPQMIEVIQRVRRFIIMKNGKPVAELFPCATAKRKRGFGSAKGLIEVADDFDAPLDDVKKYME